MTADFGILVPPLKQYNLHSNLAVDFQNKWFKPVKNSADGQKQLNGSKWLETAKK